MQITNWTNDRIILESRFGIYFDGATDYVPLSMDQSSIPVTSSNIGIPADLTRYIDPKLIEILVSPMKAARIYGEARKGDWTMDTATFSVIETSGQVASYGDFSRLGLSDINISFPQRQQFLVQTFIEWGEREQERMGLARVDLANRLRMAAAITLAKWQNRSYFFGVEGLQNYGALNDPGLQPPIQPLLKEKGGTEWESATAMEIHDDIRRLFSRLQMQTGGLVDMDTELVIVMPTTLQVYLTRTNEYGVSVTDLIHKNFPSMRLESSPELALAGGNLLQMFVPSFEGIETFTCAFSEKLRMHRLVMDDSSYRQKLTQGSWGTILTRPIFVASMIGV